MGATARLSGEKQQVSLRAVGGLSADVSNLLSACLPGIISKAGGRRGSGELKPFGPGAEIAFRGLGQEIFIITAVNPSLENYGQTRMDLLSLFCCGDR